MDAKSLVLFLGVKWLERDFSYMFMFTSERVLYCSIAKVRRDVPPATVYSLDF